MTLCGKDVHSEPWPTAPAPHERGRPAQRAPIAIGAAVAVARPKPLPLTTTG